MAHLIEIGKRHPKKVITIGDLSQFMFELFAGVEHTIVIKGLEMPPNQNLYEYRCVLQLLGTKKYIQTFVNQWIVDNLDPNNVKEYAVFVFPNTETLKLLPGVVSLAVLDNNDQRIYYNEKYAKVKKVELGIPH